MEELFKQFAGTVALSVEAAAALIITMGAVESLYAIARSAFVIEGQLHTRKKIWLRFGVWLMLGLEFELAADIIRSAISPTWVDIGQLGAIAVIRTFLNYFLEKDLDKFVEPVSQEIPARAEAKSIAA